MRNRVASTNYLIAILMVAINFKLRSYADASTKNKLETLNS